METPSPLENNQVVGKPPTPKIVFIAVGVILVVALILALNVSNRQQKSDTKAMSADQCTGDNKLIAEKCPTGYLPTDVIDAPKTETGGVADMVAPQFCCVKIDEQPITPIPTLTESAPAISPPTEAPPTQLPKITSIEPSQVIGSTPIINVPNNPSFCRGPKPTLEIKCVSNCPPGAN